MSAIAPETQLYPAGPGVGVVANGHGSLCESSPSLGTSMISSNEATSPVDVKNGIEGISPEGERVKPKQKRNKPTLSCSDCVERKTKVS